MKRPFLLLLTLAFVTLLVARTSSTKTSTTEAAPPPSSARFEEADSLSTPASPASQEEGQQLNTVGNPRPPAVNYSLQLNGGGAYFKVSPSTSLDITGPLTVEAWIKAGSVTSLQGIVERWNGTNPAEGGFALRLTADGKLQFSLRKSGTESDSITGATRLTGGAWHHVAGVFDGDQIRLYLNGRLDASKSSAIYPMAVSTDLKVGRAGDTTTGFFNGRIDEVRVTSGVRYANNFSPEKNMTPGGVILLGGQSATSGVWDFNDQSVEDFSGHGNHGSLVGGAAFSTESASDVTTANAMTSDEPGEPAAAAAGTNIRLSFDELPDQWPITFNYQGFGVIFTSEPGFIVRAVKQSLTAPVLSRPNSVFPVGSFGHGPSKNFYVNFTKPVDNLKFHVLGFDSEPFISPSAMMAVIRNGVVTHILAIPNVGRNGIIAYDFGSANIQQIERIEVFNVWDHIGLNYDEFTYTIPPPPTPTPTPTQCPNSPATSQPAQSGESLSAATPCPTPAPTPPAAPTGVAAKVRQDAGSTRDMVEVSWASVPGVEGYKVFRSDEVVPRNFKPVGGTKHNAFKDRHSILDIVPTLNKRYAYAVLAYRGIFDGAMSKEALIFVPKTCGPETLKPRPPASDVAHYSWRARAEVTDRDGLVMRDVTLNGRYMAPMVSVPYMWVTVRRGDGNPQNGGLRVTRRVELTADVNPLPGDDPNIVKSRLIRFNSTTLGSEPSNPNLRARGVMAQYAVEPLFPDSRSCLTITQHYKFGENQPGGCELSGTLPCAGFYPQVSYDFRGNDGHGPESQVEHLESIIIPQRQHFRADGVVGNVASFFRDCDGVIYDINLGRFVPLPCATSQSGLVFSHEKNPFDTEMAATVVLDGKDMTSWDNIHQTSNPFGVEIGPFPASIAPLTRFSGIWGGCPECVHSHWRWGIAGTIGAFDAGRSTRALPIFNDVYVQRFGSGSPIGFGPPAPGGENMQGLDITLSLFRDSEIHPALDYSKLINGERLLNETIRVFTTQDSSGNSFPVTITERDPKEVVFWYVVTGKPLPSQTWATGTSGKHGIFFNWKRETVPSPVLRRRVTVGNADAPAEAMTQQEDGPVSIIYEGALGSGETEFFTVDPSQVGPLPRHHANFNNTAYVIDSSVPATGQHVVTFQVPSVNDPALFADLRILHAQPDMLDPDRFIWVDRTILSPDPLAPDFATRTIRARVGSIGVFQITRVSPAPPITKTAELAVTASASAASLQEGRQLTYTINVRNNGPDAATRVKLVGHLAPEFVFESANAPAGHCHAEEGNVYCHLNPIPAGTVSTVTITGHPSEVGQVVFPPEGKDISMQAYAKSTEENETNEADNTAGVRVTVLPDPNPPPTVEITSPTGGASFPGPANITVTASASDRNGTISAVEFFENDKSIGVGQLVAPGQYRLNWNNVTFGPHTFAAVAADNAGRTTISQAVTIIVNGPGSIQITSPADGRQAAPGSDFLVTAGTSHPAGGFTKVEFFANGQLLGQGADAGGGQYSLAWNDVPRGVYLLSAVGTDASGLMTFSNSVRVVAVEPMSVTIVTPVEGTSFPTTPDVILTAEVANAPLPPSKLEFFANGVLVGEGQTNDSQRFTLTWAHVRDGFYSLSAVATDAFGRQVASKPVNIAVNTPGVSPNEFIWFDDELPAGARPLAERDGWHWIDSNPAPILGAKAHQSLIADGTHWHGFEGASFPVPVNAGERLYTYVFLHPGYVPQEIMLEWKDDAGWGHRAYWNNEGASRVSGCPGASNDCRRMGPLPLHSRWVKLEVPSEAVGLAGKTVNGMKFYAFGGRAAWDRAGKTAGAVQPPPTAADTVWFDDGVPAGARLDGVHDDWFWVPRDRRGCEVRTPAPFSKNLAHQTFWTCPQDSDNNPYRAHFFSGATQKMDVNPGDTLFTYAYLDSINKPEQIVLRWHDGTNWYGAYWGGAHTPIDTIGTERTRYMGGLPEANKWVRLEVPASYVGLEGKSVSGMYFGMHRGGSRRGLVTWDMAGKSSLPLSTSPAPLYAVTPMYRYFLSEKNFYSYFASDRYSAVGSNEGTKFYAHANQAPGTIPIYRYKHFDIDNYFYTPVAPRANGSYLFTDEWKLDIEGENKGIAFYAYPFPAPAPPGAVPLFRFSQQGRYFLTTERRDPIAIGTNMEFEDAVGWVFLTRPVISPVPNPIDDNSFFVRQHYLDFLNREPDVPGLQFWLGNITACEQEANRRPGESVADCSLRLRINVSAAFFLSIEFKESGYLAYRVYNAALDRPHNGLLRFNEFLRDAAALGEGVVVGQTGWQQKIEDNKLAFLNQFVTRDEFVALYPADRTPQQYVDALYAHARLNPAGTDVAAAVAEFGTAATSADNAARARVLRRVAESDELHAREVNRAFVLMQYFGYLRRNPNDLPDIDYEGFEHWLEKLNRFGGNFENAEMVKSFITSIEYRARFGQPVTADANAAMSASSSKAGTVTASYAGVSGEGTLSVTHHYPASLAPAPSGYEFYSNLAWDVTSTAGVSGPVTLSVALEGSFNDPAEFAALRVLNYENGAWVERTILAPDAPAPDFNTRTISARVNTVSAIALARATTTPQPPSVSITSPAAAQIVNAPADITISAGASSPSGSVAKVEFLQGDVLLGEDTAAPYQFTWAGVPVGNYSLSARVTDAEGRTANSASVQIKVNDRPAVFIAAPAHNAVFDYPTSLAINAFAGDLDGIRKVEFFHGTTKLGEDAAAPYGFTWSNVPLGSYSLTAVATDNLNTTMTSPVVAVTVRNLPPSVSITAPSNGATMGNAPASITVNASAQDGNGISKVEFFQGATSLGIDTTAPYSVAWNNVAVGTYSLTAKATDSLGAVATSVAASVTVGNAPPSVAITSPTNGSTAGNAPASITIQATATDNEGVSKVEFYQGATKLGEDTTAPYSFVWNNVGAGTYTLKAVAADTLNATTTSAAVSVTVGNAPPSVSITSPVAGTNYTAGAGVVINANATDNEGVKKVEFFQGATKLGEDATAPYSFTWSNVAAGTYSLTAKATDNLDAVATSAAVNISVGGALFTLFSDDFNDNVMDASKWYVTDPASTSLVAERNQRLELTPATASAVTAYNGYASIPFMDMTNAQIIVEVPQYAPTYGHQTIFLLSGSSGSYLMFYAGGGGLVMQDSVTADAGRTVLASYNTAQQRFWRFRHEPLGDKVLWESSGDGVAWITQRSVTRPFAITSMQVQLLGGKYSGVAASPATAVFDNLKVASTVANTQPTVSITSPTAGTVFTAPASATITANAADSDGSITRVEFFSGSASLGVDTTAPYSVDVTNAAAGTYSLTARATDNRGGITNSAPVSVTVNAPPSVSMTAPANGTIYTAPATITLGASASDADGTVSKVEFLQNGVLLATDTAAPYAHTWSGLGAGSYALTARATDNRGAVSTSAAVNVSVNAPNVAPNVSLTSPAGGSVFDAPATVNLQAVASDGDGSVASVEFFRNGVSLGTDTTAPYSFTLSNIAVGTYSLTAKATDNLGAATLSEAVSITVATPPFLPLADTIGVYTGSTFQLRNSNTAGQANISTVFGMPGWTPVVGDWDGNGTTTLGVFVPEASQQGFPGQSLFYLSNRLDYSYSDTTVVFGLPGDRPVAGDWDGNGTVTIGVYRPSEYKFYLRNSNTAGQADLVVAFTAYSGDAPVAGDWDGDGVDTVGMHDSSSATFYLRNTNASGPLNVTVSFGNSGDIPVVGDWDGDGTTTVGSYKSSSATWYLRNSNTTGQADVVVQYGTAGNSIPVAGNWDGTRPACCGDTVWFDDALPAGAIAVADGDPWSWVQSGPVPFSGVVAHQSAAASATHQHYFYNATQTLSVAAGEKLYAYVYLDPANPPTQVMLQWNDGTWEHRAYWGANQLPWGVDGTASRRNMGPLPPTGQWVRLEVPASQVDLEGRVLSGMAFSLYGGRATWDRAGKTTAPTPRLIISEFRFRGAGGASDEFVELYNNSDSPATVSATDGSGGWALVASDGNTRFVVPDGTVVPARGHYLATGAGYSLVANSPGDKSYPVDIPDNAGIALFNTANSSGFTSANRLDAVGFSSVTNDLYLEGTGLSPLGAVDTEFSFARLLTSGLPQDSNNNAGDFMFLSTTGGSVGSSVLSWLGGAGPENLSNPRPNDITLSTVLIDSAVSSSTAPNRVRLQCESTPDCNPTTAPMGTMIIRRRVTNNSGTTITTLRYRVVNVTTLNSPGYVLGGGQADVRALSSGTSTVALSNGSTVQVYGTTLEQPPNQPNGGGYNSTLRVLLPTGGLPPGASINVQFLLGVKQTGSFRFLLVTEALP